MVTSSFNEELVTQTAPGVPSLTTIDDAEEEDHPHQFDEFEELAFTAYAVYDAKAARACKAAAPRPANTSGRRLKRREAHAAEQRQPAAAAKKTASQARASKRVAKEAAATAALAPPLPLGFPSRALPSPAPAKAVEVLKPWAHVASSPSSPAHPEDDIFLGVFDLVQPVFPSLGPISLAENRFAVLALLGEEEEEEQQQQQQQQQEEEEEEAGFKEQPKREGICMRAMRFLGGFVASAAAAVVAIVKSFVCIFQLWTTFLFSLSLSHTKYILLPDHLS